MEADFFHGPQSFSVAVPFRQLHAPRRRLFVAPGPCACALVHRHPQQKHDVEAKVLLGRVHPHGQSRGPHHGRPHAPASAAAAHPPPPATTPAPQVQMVGKRRGGYIVAVHVVVAVGSLEVPVHGGYGDGVRGPAQGSAAPCTRTTGPSALPRPPGRHHHPVPPPWPRPRPQARALAGRKGRRRA
jgi:hypothetical protein